MNVKKILPWVLLLAMALATIGIKRCNNQQSVSETSQRKTENRRTTTNSEPALDRNTNKLFFTKHAKCRMKCRNITQKEVKDILVNGRINYNKSNLNDARGASYAIEGKTRDRQRVRIIFSPKKQHVTVVTVIDLENEFACNCN